MKYYTIHALFLRALKIALSLFITLYIPTLSAQNSLLDKEISITFQNDNLASALKKIEETANCYFSYESIESQNSREISNAYTDTSLREILNDLLVEYQIYYRMRGNTILIQNDAKNGQVMGRVSNQAGEPIPFASVLLKGTGFGSSTSAEGDFNFLAPEGNYIIVASSVGFENVTQAITIVADEVATVNLTLNQTSETLEDVVVVGKREIGYVAIEQSGATFGNRDLVDIPLSVTAITQEVLIDQQVRQLGDLVRNDPSVLVTNPLGLNETINIRGFALDNSSSYRRENLIFQNQAQSPFENKAAVEIIKGPAAIRYGFTPPGGIINYVLKKPTDEPYTFLQLFGDSNGSIGLHGDFGGKLNEKFGYRVNAVVAREATFVDGLAGPRQLFSAFFEWEILENLRVDIEAEYQYRELESQASIRTNSFDESVTPEQRRQLIENFDRTTFIGQEWGTYPTRSFINSLGVSYEISENWSFQARIQHMNLIRDQKDGRIDPGTLQANGDFEVTTFFDPAQVRDPISMEGFINGNFNTFGLEHNVSFGGAYSRNPLSFSSSGGNISVAIGTSNIFNPVQYDFPGTGDIPTPTSGLTRNSIVFTQHAFFVTDFIKVANSLELLAGVRYTNQKNEDVFNPSSTLQTSYEDDVIVPNFGIIYTPVENWNIYGSYSLGITNGVQVPNDADNFGEDVFLDPVETEQFEFGLKAEVFKEGLLTAAYFNVDQPLALIDDSNIFRYGGSQRHRGVEVTLAGQISDAARVIVGGLYLDAEIDNPSEPELNGKRPASIPEFQTNIFVDYRLPIDGLDVNAGLYYTGDRFADDPNTFEVDGYTRLDLGARYRFNIQNAKMTARLNVRNVTNADFVEGLAFGLFAFGAPATAIFSLTAEF